MPGYDLHIHTTASDGILTVEEVTGLAIELGIKGIAITDHDTVRNLDRALELSRELSYPIIPGIELSTEFWDHEIHILGYLFDHHLPAVQEKLQHLQTARKERIFLMIEKINQLGYCLSQEEVTEFSGGDSLGRPHIAYALINKGYISSVQEAFRKLIGRGGPAYVPRVNFSPFEAIAFIKQSGGIPVLAHPGLAKSDGIIKDLVRAGLQGIEVYHPDHNQDDENKYRKMARDMQLIITGGSDFHGHKDGTHFPLGAKTVSAEEIQTLLERMYHKNIIGDDQID